MNENSTHKPKHILLPRFLGSTLLEILVVVALFGIILLFTVPPSRQLFEEGRTIAEVNQLVGGLYYARSSAVEQNATVVFCKSTTHRTCGGNWHDGQIVLQASQGRVLRVLPALSTENQLIWNSSGGQDDRVEWLPTGYTNGQRGTFYFCATKAPVQFSRKIVLLNTGRIYVSPITADDYKSFCQSFG